MAYDLAIFDFDGTLADSAEWMAGVFNDVAERYGYRRVGERKNYYPAHGGREDAIVMSYKL